MITISSDGFGTALSIPSEHGLLHGQLDYLPGATGMVVLAYAAPVLDTNALSLAKALRQAGLSTFVVELLAHREERYADVHNNVPLLARRLLDFLEVIKKRIQLGEIEDQPFGLYATQATSPVVVRVAALRDHDIAAIVCRGGLIDLAGMLYLHALASPLLLLVDAGDEARAASGRRALRELRCSNELKQIAVAASALGAACGIDSANDETVRWFVAHFGRRDRD